MSDESDFILAIGTIFGNILNAYTKGKEIDAQREAIRANYRIEKRKLELQKQALDFQHKENMEKINAIEKLFFEQLDAFRAQISHNRHIQDKLIEDARVFRDKILDDNISLERMNMAADFYNKILDKIFAYTEENHSLLLDNMRSNNVSLIMNNQKQINK